MLCRETVSVTDGETFQHALRHQDLTGLSCLLSHGVGLGSALMERIVESCGPRCLRDCMLDAVASARYAVLNVNVNSGTNSIMI